MRPFRPVRAGLRINLAGQCHDPILYVVFNTLVEPVLDESSVQIFLDTLVQIRIDCLSFTFGSWRNHPNLV